MPQHPTREATALRKAFAAWRGEAEGVHVVCAPGRVNLIGEHTDYNDGFVLPVTLGRAVYIALRPRGRRSGSPSLCPL